MTGVGAALVNIVLAKGAQKSWETNAVVRHLTFVAGAVVQARIAGALRDIRIVRSRCPGHIPHKIAERVYC